MWTLLASLIAAMQIHATGDCPAAASVDRQLDPLLLGGGPAARTSDVATIKQDGDGAVFVSLNDVDGRPVGDRRFPRTGTCDDMAQTVAVTLAIWEAQIHPEISLRLDRLSPAAVASVASPTVARGTRVADAPASPMRTAVFVGVAGGGDWQPGSWAPAVLVELGVGPIGARWRVRLAAVGIGRHALEVDPGQARWWRAFMSLGADYDVARGHLWAAVIGAGAVVGVASISGSGYAVDQTSRSVDVAGEATVRGEWRPGRLRPWASVSLRGWLRRQNLDLQGANSSAALPRAQPTATLGVDFAW